MRVVAADDGAGRCFSYGLDIIYAASGALREAVVMKVRNHVAFGNRSTLGNSICHGKLLLRRVDHVKVLDARARLCLLSAVQEVWNRDSKQNGDDRDNDHDLDEGKSFAFASVHFSVPVVIPFNDWFPLGIAS